MANILIADDHPLTLAGTKAFVERVGHRVIECCTNGIIAYNSICQTEPDIAILDINMPGLTGLDIIEKIKPKNLRTRVILLTMHNEKSVFLKAKSLGVRGYILKEHAIDELADCLQNVLSGSTYTTPHLDKLKIDKDQESSNEVDKLTFAERKIAELIANQHSSKEIAEMLFISERTVENHRSNIINKLDLAKTKNALFIWATKNLVN